MDAQETWRGLTAPAPVTPGFYTFQWQMLQEGVAWFGDPTPNLLITVLEAPEGLS